MILVFGGTTEGKRVAHALEKAGKHYVYSTKTKIGFQGGTYGSYRFGAFTCDSLIQFCQENRVEAIVHASHPFAAILHQTIHEAALVMSVPVIRFERSYPQRIRNPKVTYVSSYEEAMVRLSECGCDRLLALTGVQTIERLRSYWEKHFSVFRILPRESSVALALQSGFPKENLVLEFPGDDLQRELALIGQFKVNGILTKESGESGFLSTKIEAGLRAGIQVVIIERPTLPETFIKVSGEEKLLDRLSQAMV